MPEAPPLEGPELCPPEGVLEPDAPPPDGPLEPEMPDGFAPEGLLEFELPEGPLELDGSVPEGPDVLLGLLLFDAMVKFLSYLLEVITRQVFQNR